MSDEKKEPESVTAEICERTGANIPSSDSAPQSQHSERVGALPNIYLRDAAGHLLSWMDKLKNSNPTSRNVNSICNLAKEIGTLVMVSVETKKSNG